MSIRLSYLHIFCVSQIWTTISAAYCINRGDNPIGIIVGYLGGIIIYGILLWYCAKGAQIARILLSALWGIISLISFFMIFFRNYDIWQKFGLGCLSILYVCLIIKLISLKNQTFSKQEKGGLGSTLDK